MFCDFKRLPCTLNNGLVYHFAAQRNRALALFLADADRLEHKPCVFNILCGRAEYFVYYAHMARCNRGFAAEAEAFCIFRIAHYALVVVNVGERSVINIDPGRTGGANEPRAGIVYLVALLCALAAQIRRQILAAEE